MERRDEMRALISEEAAEWLLRLKGEKLSSSERLRYVKWLKQSPSHIAEMLRISEVDGLLGVVSLQGIVGDAAHGSNVVEHPARDRRAERESGSTRDDGPEFGEHPGARASKWRPAWPAWLGWKVATGFSAAAVAIVAGVLVVSVFPVDRDISTEIGVWRKVTLSDGSVVDVGPLSYLSFDFTEKQRNVYLTKGEAVFQVAKNPQRPFFVNTDLAVVRAVGTKFEVTRREDGRVLVTVKEGKVQVTQGAAVQIPVLPGKQRPARVATTTLALAKNEQIAISSQVWPQKAEPVNAEIELAWAEKRRFTFIDGATIGQAAEQFNRRNRIQILIEDPGLAEKPACCAFDVDDPESFAQSVVTASRETAVLVRDGASTLRIVPANPGDMNDDRR